MLLMDGEKTLDQRGSSFLPRWNLPRGGEKSTANEGFNAQIICK